MDHLVVDGLHDRNGNKAAPISALDTSSTAVIRSSSRRGDIRSREIRGPRSLDAHDAERIAEGLSRGRRIHRNREGWRTYCPICTNTSNRRRARPALSVTVRDGRLLVFCHRAHCESVEIIGAVVGLGLVPNNFKESSKAFALADRVERAVATATWIGIGPRTDLAVLPFLIGVTRQSCRTEIGAAVRTTAEHAGVTFATVSRSLKRLARAGWIKSLTNAKGTKAGIWRIQVPPMRGDQTETIKHDSGACDRLFRVGPCDPAGGRTGASRSAPPVGHDLFRWRGLGKPKGRIFGMLTLPMTAREIAAVLGFKNVSSARVHLRVLIRQGLVKRLLDGRYERGDANLDALAEELGVAGSTDRQREQHAAERERWVGLNGAFEHWKKTGEVLDPETGQVLACQEVPSSKSRMHTFKQRVSLLKWNLTSATAEATILDIMPSADNLSSCLAPGSGWGTNEMAIMSGGADG